MVTFETNPAVRCKVKGNRLGKATRQRRIRISRLRDATSLSGLVFRLADIN
jgi:hypothetical protein